MGTFLPSPNHPNFHKVRSRTGHTPNSSSSQRTASSGQLQHLSVRTDRQDGHRVLAGGLQHAWAELPGRLSGSRRSGQGSAGAVGSSPRASGVRAELGVFFVLSLQRPSCPSGPYSKARVCFSELPCTPSTISKFEKKQK